MNEIKENHIKQCCWRSATEIIGVEYSARIKDGCIRKVDYNKTAQRITDLAIALFNYSKNEGFWDRSLRQRTKHKRRLSGDASLDAYEMPKPKGMWRRTFYRLQRAAQAAENRAADDFIIAAGRLVKVG